VLIVGAGSLGQKVRSQLLEDVSADFKFVGFIDELFDEQIDANFIAGNFSNIKDRVKQLQVSDVIIALPHSHYSDMSRIVQSIDDAPVQVWVALGFFDLALYKMNIEDFAGIPMLDLRASAIDEYQRMLKRAFDILFGSLALIIVSPIMILIAIMVFLQDGFPILFRQKRVGENGRLFEMLKFRTMLKNAEQLQSQVERRDENGNIIHKNKDDWRVTKVGKILRRFSLDELPQFVNVIRGDMSLVGPRPELPHLVEKYQPWQRKRFAIPPGLTGWWQVNGRSDKPMHLNTEEDIYYIQNYSILLDIQILFKTVWVVLAGKGSY
jgi:exopolysaccharide biosynthesis polyprenyl glycosylphosphotransferase